MVNKLAFITLTNYGYRFYTDNLIQSLENVGVGDILNVYCIDEDAYSFFKKKRPNNNVFLIKDLYGKKVKEFIPYQEDNWEDVVYNKLNIIRNLLKKDIDVVFIDGDIVFLKNPVEYLKKIIAESQDYDCIFQNDCKEGDSELENICTGFMYLKATTTNIDLLYPYNKIFDVMNNNPQVFRKNFIICDQLYFNSIRTAFKYKCFKVAEFSNGFHWKKLMDKEDYKPYLIHFNWMRGHEKKAEMVKNNYWYI
jgi:hypothetical protein